MSEIWIAPIAALIGTIIGATTPIFLEFFKNKVNRSYFKKEKHEKFTRIMLHEFLPAIRKVTDSLEVFTRDEYIHMIDSYSAELKKNLEKVIKLFENDIKDIYPLEMVKEMEGLTYELNSLNAYIDYQEMTGRGLDQNKDYLISANSRFKETIEKYRKILLEKYI